MDDGGCASAGRRCEEAGRSEQRPSARARSVPRSVRGVGLAGLCMGSCCDLCAVFIFHFSTFGVHFHTLTHTTSAQRTATLQTLHPRRHAREKSSATSKDSRLTTPAPRTATSNGRASRAALTRTPSSASVRRSSAQSSRSQPAARQRAARPLRLDEGRGPHLFEGLAPQPLRL